MSADGTTVIGYVADGDAFRWTASTGAVSLGSLPGVESQAWGVNADGSVVVGVSSQQAFRWTASTGMVGLGFLPGDNLSDARGVSADGSVVAGFSATLSFHHEALLAPSRRAG